MKRSDIVVAFALAAVIGLVWVAVERPPWLYDATRQLRRWIAGNPAETRERQGRRHSLLIEQLRQNVPRSGANSVRPVDDSVAFTVIDFATKRAMRDFRFCLFPDFPDRESQRTASGWVTVSDGDGTLLLRDAYDPKHGSGAIPPATNVLVVTSDGYETAQVPLSKLFKDWQSDSNALPRILLHPLPARQPLLSVLEAELNDAMDRDRLRQTADSRAQPPAPVALPGTLQGHIEIQNHAVSEGRITLRGDQLNPPLTSELRSGGAFSFEDVAPGNYQVTVHATADGTVWRDHAESVRIEPGATTRLVYVFPAQGAVKGRITGLRADESGGVFAIKGDFRLENVSEDDLYDLGGIADAESSLTKDGTFELKGLETGRYTIVAIAQHFGSTSEERAFWYVTGTVEIPADGEAEISLSVN